jgi:DNA repair exonuclease SbcCD ATPase subunit
MNEEETTGFKMRIDDESPDLHLQERMGNKRLEELGKRVTLISIIIPLIICVVLFLAYFSIKKNVDVIQHTGAEDILKLSKNLESSFASLSQKHDQLNESANKSIESLEKTISSLQAELKEATTAIRYIRSARKADNQKYNSNLADLKETLASMGKELEKVVSDMETIEDGFNQKLVEFNRSIGNVKDILQADIDSLASTKADIKSLDLKLDKEKKAFQQKLNQLSKTLEEKMESIRHTLQGLDRSAKLPGKGRSIPSQNTAPSKSASNPKPTPEEEPVIPKQRTLIEEDIIE